MTANLEFISTLSITTLIGILQEQPSLIEYADIHRFDIGQLNTLAVQLMPIAEIPSTFIDMPKNRRIKIITSYCLKKAADMQPSKLTHREAVIKHVYENKIDVHRLKDHIEMHPGCMDEIDTELILNARLVEYIIFKIIDIKAIPVKRLKAFTGSEWGKLISHDIEYYNFYVLSGRDPLAVFHYLNKPVQADNYFVFRTMTNNTIRMYVNTTDQKVIKFSQDVTITEKIKEAIIKLCVNLTKPALDSDCFWDIMQQAGINVPDRPVAPVRQPALIKFQDNWITVEAMLDLPNSSLVTLLREDPKLALNIPDERFSTFTGSDWGKVLKLHMELADRCDINTLSDVDKIYLFAEQPKLATYESLNKLPVPSIINILFKNMAIRFIVDWSRFSARDWVELLTEKPSFREAMLYSSYNVDVMLSVDELIARLRTIIANEDR